MPLDDAVIEHHADEDEEHDDDEDQARLVLVGADLTVEWRRGLGKEGEVGQKGYGGKGDGRHTIWFYMTHPRSAQRTL